MFNERFSRNSGTRKNKEFQWSTWAIARDKSGKIDFNKTLTGPDLKKFVDDILIVDSFSTDKTIEIAEKLNVSLVPVREGIEKLKQHGWIKCVNRSGTYVNQLSEEGM